MIDFSSMACFNIDMLNLNSSKKANTINNLNSSLNLNTTKQYNIKKDVYFLLKRLKDKKEKVTKGRFIFLATTISTLVISGLIISF